MARMPGAIWVGEQSPRRPMVRYDGVCVHTIVGFAPAHAAHFSVKADGTILQSRDTAFQSAANLDGNPRIIAIENEDHGGRFPNWDGSNVPALTPEQVASNALILYWAHKTHGVPLQKMPDSRPGSRGLASHRLGCDGNFTDGFRGRVPGGERWTSHFGKVCPGRRRLEQIDDILAQARALNEEDPLAKFDDEIQEILQNTRQTVRRLKAQEPRMKERIAAVKDAVEDLQVDADKVPKLRARVARLREKMADLEAEVAEANDSEETQQ